MKFFLLIFLISFSLFASDIKSDLRQLDNPAAGITCQSCAQPLSHEKASILTDINNEKLELTVLSMDEARSYISEFLANQNIPFNYALDGCYARAHKMAVLLDEKGIISAKAFLRGRLFANTKYGPVNWRYHVAPVVLLKIDNEIKPYVLDPSLFDRPVPYEEWKDHISGVMPNGRRMGPPPFGYYTNRFVYDLTSSYEKRTEYNPDDLADADATLARYLEIKKKLDERLATK